MMIWMQKILNFIKDNILQNKLIKFWAMLLIAVLVICTQNNHVMAASGVRVYNYTSKKEYTYMDKQIKVTYNGKKISVDKTPGILQNGIALVSYKDIFAKSPIKADCVYDKAAGTVSISKFGITIVMKIGSKTAHINGKAVTMPLAPVKIKYVDANVTKILVPSRFVSENLGFKYTWHKNTSTVAIESKEVPMLLSYDDGDKFYYSGTQGKVTIDGENVDLGKMPSVITNNTAMLRAKRVFADSKIKAEYKYNAKDKSITLSRNGNTLKMTIGSPVAYLNDRAMVLDTAPMIVTNHDVGTSYVMVPGSFTATCLGFDYRWDKANMTSIIISREEDSSEVKPDDSKTPQPDKGEDSKSPQPDKEEDLAPELGDSGVTWDKGNILQQWEVSKDLIGVNKGLKNINMDDSDTSAIRGSIYSINPDTSKNMVNTETYAVIANVPFSTVTSKVTGRQLQLDISNMNCVDNTYNMRYMDGIMLDTIRAYNANNSHSILEFNVLTNDFTYDLSLSADKQILYVTIYYNYLSKVTIGTNDTMDYITLTGSKPLDVVINQSQGYITVDLLGIYKGIKNQYASLFGAKNLYSVNLYDTSRNMQLFLGLNNYSQYYIVEDGINYTIMFPSNDTPFIPVTPEKPKEPNMPQEPQVPQVPNNGNNEMFEIIIPNPAGLTTEQIKHEDQYSNHRFAIRLPGDYSSYFDINPIRVNGAMIKDISVFANSKNETEILVTTSKLQGYEISADQNNIYVNVGNPRDIYKNIVVLDPGHGGPAPGAVYFNTKEKTINFKILYEIGKDFFNSNPSKLKVYYTREKDVDLSLADRAAFAEKVGADLFVSLHMNASTSSSVHGTEVYYSTKNNSKNKAGLNSETLAKLLANNLSSSLKTNNRGAKAARYTVVHNNTVPAVLIELGFMSNKNDFAKITDPSLQYEAAKVIYETLLQVFELYPTGR